MKKIIYIFLLHGCVVTKTYNNNYLPVDKSKRVYVNVSSNYAADSLSNILQSWVTNLGYKKITHNEIHKELKSGKHVKRAFAINNTIDIEKERLKVIEELKDDRFAWFTALNFYFHFYIDSKTNNYCLDSAFVQVIPQPNYNPDNINKYPKISLPFQVLYSKSLTFVMAKLVDSITHN